MELVLHTVFHALAWVFEKSGLLRSTHVIPEVVLYVLLCAPLLIILLIIGFKLKSLFQRPNQTQHARPANAPSDITRESIQERMRRF